MTCAASNKATWRGHQPPAHLVLADSVANPLIADCDLIAQSRSGDKKRLEDFR
jgi:hypothetical protein